MGDDTLVLLVIVASALLGTGFTILPLLPGTLFIPLGAVACALVIGWDEFPWWFWAAQAAFVVAYVVVDYIAQVLGVRRVGGSRQAIVGGAIGVFAGPLLLALVLGPLALFIGPPIGAVVGTIWGESRARARAAEAGAVADPAADPAVGYRRLGIGALIAFVVGTTIKLAIITVQVGLLALVAW